MISIAGDASDPNADQAPSPNRPQKRRVQSHEDRARAWTAELTARVQMVCQGRSNGQVGKLTHAHPETVRRYLNGQSVPSCLFITALCEAFGLSAEWMLHGRGDQLRPDRSELAHPSLREEIRVVKDGIQTVERHIERMESVLRDDSISPAIPKLAPAEVGVESKQKTA